MSSKDAGREDQISRILAWERYPTIEDVRPWSEAQLSEWLDGGGADQRNVRHTKLEAMDPEEFSLVYADALAQRAEAKRQFESRMFGISPGLTVLDCERVSRAVFREDWSVDAAQFRASDHQILQLIRELVGRVGTPSEQQALVEVMSIGEVAELFKVSKGTIRRWEKHDPNFPKRITAANANLGWRSKDIKAEHRRRFPA